MGSFVFIKYDGDDAGEVLVTMLDSDSGPETHEIPAKVSRPIGFMPNPEPDEEPDDEPDEEEDDGEQHTD